MLVVFLRLIQLDSIIKIFFLFSAFFFFLLYLEGLKAVMYKQENQSFQQTYSTLKIDSV
jgi:hypothetical protein